MRHGLACTVSEPINRAPLPRQGSLERRPRGLTGGEVVRGPSSGNTVNCRVSGRSHGEPGSSSLGKTPRLSCRGSRRSRSPALLPGSTRRPPDSSAARDRVRGAPRPRPGRSRPSAVRLQYQLWWGKSRFRPLLPPASERSAGDLDRCSTKKITVGWLECLRVDGGDDLKLVKIPNRFHTISNFR